MPSDSGQRDVNTNRPPRVRISYADPQDPNRLVELPFVMGVMADLSGNAGEEKPGVGERSFADFNVSNFGTRMKAIEPKVSFHVADKLSGDDKDKLSVELKFSSMEDFSPAAIARQVPALAKLLDERERLQNLLRYMDGKVQAGEKLNALLKDPALLAALGERRSSKSE